jgi:hypothetical protein
MRTLRRREIDARYPLPTQLKAGTTLVEIHGILWLASEHRGHERWEALAWARLAESFGPPSKEGRP